MVTQGDRDLLQAPQPLSRGARSVALPVTQAEDLAPALAWALSWLL